MTEYTRAELIAARIRCDQDLLFFTRFFFKQRTGKKFTINNHHRILCDEFDNVEQYETKLLNINIPPRHSKTELMLNFIARGIGKNPTSNWIYVTASDDLRSEVSVKIRDIITHPYFKIMYDIEMKKDQNAKNLWRTTKGGGLKTASIFGQITGFGAGQIPEEPIDIDEDSVSDLLEHLREFEGCQCWDDLNKMNDSDAENANNQKVSDVVFNTLLSRENSDDTPIVHIQQRAGMSDVTAQLKEHFTEGHDRYKYIVMPVITDGIPLWPSKLGVEAIELLRTSPKTEHVFETQYMQNPLRREGLCFDIDELNRYDHTKFDIDSDDIDAKAGFVDVADKGDDFLCAPIGLVVQNKIFIHDVVFTTDEVLYSNPHVAMMFNEHKPEWVRVESNGGGALYIQLLKEQENINDLITLLPISAKGNKHTRIMATSAFIKKYCYFREVYDPNSDYGKFMKNLTEYQKDGKSKHDDAPDGLTGLCVMIKRFYEHLYPDAIEQSEDGYGNG